MAPSYSVQDALSKILKLVSKPWVRDYLFNSTDESDLKILTSKPQVQHAFSGKLSMSVINPTGILAMFATAYTDATWAAIPAYNIEELSASILLKEGQSDHTLPSGMRYSTTSCVRFVRNDENGDCLSVSLDSDFAEITIVFWDSPTHRHNHFMMFPKNVILDEMCSDRPINVARLAASVAFYIHFDQIVMCSKCNPVGIGYCTCRTRLELYRANHVLDFSNSARNMAVNVGSFVGTGRTLSSVFSNQVLMPCRGATVYSSMIAGNAPGAVPGLISAGISQRLRKRVQPPPRAPRLVEPASSVAVEDIRIGNEFRHANGPRTHGWHEIPMPRNVPASSNVLTPAGPIGIVTHHVIGGVVHCGRVARFPNPLPAPVQVNHLLATYDSNSPAVAPPVSTLSEEDKKLKRQMRNRETAFRSIQKRKVLTENITKEHRKLEKLREREKKLQEENNLLRKQLQCAGNDDNVSSLSSVSQQTGEL